MTMVGGRRRTLITVVWLALACAFPAWASAQQTGAVTGRVVNQETGAPLANARVEAAKPDWQRQKQKLGSYEVLQARGEAAEAKVTARRDQRDADEHAARILRMRAEGV